MGSGYVHGYDEVEMRRLQDQATTLSDLLHDDTSFPPGASVLEAGCGVGAQTLPLLRNSPGVHLTCIDVSPESLEQARHKVQSAGFKATFRTADIFALPFSEAAFDHVFLCFVLEHLANPIGALQALQKMLRPGGTLTVIEGDHGSTYFWPDSEYARRAIQCQVELQARACGDANIGRRLYPLLVAAGFDAPQISPRMVYVDGSKPLLIDGFTRRTFTAMIEGVREQSLASGLSTPDAFDRGVADLHRTASDDGVFCYTFFKGIARRPTE